MRRVMELPDCVCPIVAPGAVGRSAAIAALRDRGVRIRSPRPRSAHGTEGTLDKVARPGCHHPSRQSTFTSSLTAPMLDAIRQRICEVAA